jgi:hypothetical protein
MNEEREEPGSSVPSGQSQKSSLSWALLNFLDPSLHFIKSDDVL